MQTFQIVKEYNSFEEVFSSEEWNSIWEGYVSSEKKMRERNFIRTKFVAAYKVDMNPVTNYGRPFDIYVHYVLEEGLNVLNKMEVHTCLSNYPFRRVFIKDLELKISDQFYPKTAENRRMLSNVGYIIT